MSNASNDSGDGESDRFSAAGTSKVKKPKGHGSHRITPPEEVRSAVGMEADEPWSWFYHTPSDRFWLRRAGAQLSGIPGNSVSVGVAEARQNGRYMDFAIPPSAVETVGLEKGQRWRFEALDRNTMQLTRDDDSE